MNRNRREFLENVGSGMLIAGLGSSLTANLGISTAFANEGVESLSFGKLQPLVGLLQESPVEKLQPILVKKLKSGDADLRQLIAAAALANAETFGGEDYVGFHTEMALLPAYQIAQELPKEQQPLPVLKVLYRNTHRIQESGWAKNKVLKPVSPAELPNANHRGKLLRQATRAVDYEHAERLFAGQVKESIKDAYDSLLWSVQDNADVHRFVLAHRAFGLISIVGEQDAHTLLRQCVRFCLKSEQNRKERKRAEPPVRKLIPKLLDQYGLLERKLGTRRPDDAWFAEMSQFIHTHNPEETMDAIAAALHDGISIEAIGEATSLAANQLVLRQGKRRDGGSRCHGDSPGVHSSDSINAWRNMARITTKRNAVVGMLVGAYHVAQFNNHTESEPFPLEAHREAVKTTDAKSLLQEAAAAIRENDQGRATAAIQIYGEQGYAPRPVFQLMRKFAISEDGRLHGEKYYRTVTEEYATTRPAFRWRQLVALARVTASSYGYNRQDAAGHRAPGFEEACRLLDVKV